MVQQQHLRGDHRQVRAQQRNVPVLDQGLDHRSFVLEGRLEAALVAHVAVQQADAVEADQVAHAGDHAGAHLVFLPPGLELRVPVPGLAQEGGGVQEVAEEVEAQGNDDHQQDYAEDQVAGGGIQHVQAAGVLRGALVRQIHAEEQPGTYRVGGPDRDQGGGEVHAWGCQFRYADHAGRSHRGPAEGKRHRVRR